MAKLGHNKTFNSGFKISIKCFSYWSNFSLVVLKKGAARNGGSSCGWQLWKCCEAKIIKLFSLICCLWTVTRCRKFVVCPMYSALHPLQNSTYITFLALHVSSDFTTKGFWRFLKVTVGFSMIKSHTPHRAFLHLKTPLFSVSRSSNLAPVNICFKFGGFLKPLIIFFVYKCRSYIFIQI